MQELQKIVTSLIDVTEREWQSFAQKLIRKEFKAKEFILQEGRVATDLYFVETGLLRTFHILNDKEISTYFACDGQFITAFSSFITQKPSLEFLETIEDSVVYALSFQNQQVLYQESPKFEKLGRIFAEKSYLCVMERTLMMQTKTAKEKYLDFLESFNPKIVQQVPQHQIATFLGITPESLSRIRKEISIS